MSRCIARYSTHRSRPQVGQWWEANTTSRVFGPQREGLGDVVRPGMGVSNHGSADGEDVMQSVGGVLGHTEGVAVGEVEVHFRRCLRAWSHLEHNAHAIDSQLLTGMGDVKRRRDQGGLPVDVVCPRPAPICPAGPFSTAAPYM